MSDDRFVIRTPNGVVFTYGNPVKCPERGIDYQNFDFVARARSVDCLSDPKKLSVGEMLDALTVLEQIPTAWRSTFPVVNDQCVRRKALLRASPGFAAFTDWQEGARLHRLTPVEAAREFLIRLGEKTGRLSRELRLMPLLDAVRLLSQPKAAPGPAKAPPPLGDEQTAASPARPHRGDGQAAAADASGTVAPPPTALPQSLDSRAVGFAHEMLEKGGWINVAEVARRLGLKDRTKLYRSCPGFLALVKTDRQSNRDRKAGFRRGSKDRQTGRIECADDR